MLATSTSMKTLFRAYDARDGVEVLRLHYGVALYKQVAKTIFVSILYCIAPIRRIYALYIYEKHVERVINTS